MTVIHINSTVPVVIVIDTEQVESPVWKVVVDDQADTPVDSVTLPDGEFLAPGDERSKEAIRLMVDSEWPQWQFGF